VARPWKVPGRRKQEVCQGVGDWGKGGGNCGVGEGEGVVRRVWPSSSLFAGKWVEYWPQGDIERDREGRNMEVFP
jgi:hypothetical protein